MTAVLASIAAAGISGIVAFTIYSFHALRGDVTGLRTELRAEMPELRAEMSELRAEMSELREEMRRGFADLRAARPAG